MHLYDMFSTEVGEHDLIGFILATTGPSSRHRSTVRGKSYLLQATVFSLEKEACDANTH